MRVRFLDRAEAGRRLAQQVAGTVAERGDAVVVVGLPRGGVPVAEHVAAALGAPLDVIVVRKLGVPYQPELAMGAIGEDAVLVTNDEIVRMALVDQREFAKVVDRERIELERRARRFRAGRTRIPLKGRTVVVVDDGIATGSTARAACDVARAEGAARVVLATPVAPADWTERLAGAADDFICVANPEPFYAIGQFYENFSQTTDEEVLACLDRGARRPVTLDDPPDDSPAGEVFSDPPVELATGGVRLDGDLTVPPGARGIVVFAHGSGSSRHSPRNRYVAALLQRAGLATLLFDLLTVEEEVDRQLVFDVDLLGSRLVDVAVWVGAEDGLADLPLGFFGASTGAAAALWAASEPGLEVAAIVSRGGRPDLAGPRLGRVRAPTLLIVGGDDDIVLRLNREARDLLTCENHLAVIPGASHLFEEPGTLDAAAHLAREWFLSHLGARS
jgi:putative phosphoribosyl transferase